MKIPISSGRHALIDEDDYELLSKYRWCTSHGYASTSVYLGGGRKNKKSVVYRMHRLVMDAQPGQIVDHINGNRLDNRKQNLRFCTHAENMRNSKPHKNSTQPYKGVKKHRNKWLARIMHNRKEVSLGMYETPEQAAEAYDSAAKKYHGEFALTNQETK